MDEMARSYAFDPSDPYAVEVTSDNGATLRTSVNALPDHMALEARAARLADQGRMSAGEASSFEEGGASEGGGFTGLGERGVKAWKGLRETIADALPVSQIASGEGQTPGWEAPGAHDEGYAQSPPDGDRAYYREIRTDGATREDRAYGSAPARPGEAVRWTEDLSAAGKAAEDRRYLEEGDATVGAMRGEDARWAGAAPPLPPRGPAVPPPPPAPQRAPAAPPERTTTTTRATYAETRGDAQRRDVGPPPSPKAPPPEKPAQKLSYAESKALAERVDAAVGKGNRELAKPASQGPEDDGLVRRAIEFLEGKGHKVQTAPTVNDAPPPPPGGPRTGLYAPSSIEVPERERVGATAQFLPPPGGGVRVMDPSNARPGAPPMALDAMGDGGKVQNALFGPTAPPASSTQVASTTVKPAAVDAGKWMAEKQATPQGQQGSDGGPVIPGSMTREEMYGQAEADLYARAAMAPGGYVAGSPARDVLGGFTVQRQQQGGQGLPEDSARALAETQARAEDATRRRGLAEQDQARDVDYARREGEAYATQERARIEETTADSRAAAALLAGEMKAEEIKRANAGWWDGTSSGQKIIDVAGAVLLGILNPIAMMKHIEKASERPRAEAGKRSEDVDKWQAAVNASLDAGMTPALAKLNVEKAGLDRALWELDHQAQTSRGSPIVMKRLAEAKALFQARRREIVSTEERARLGTTSEGRSENWRHLEATRGGYAGKTLEQRAALMGKAREAESKVGGGQRDLLKITGENDVARRKEERENPAQIIHVGNTKTPWQLPPSIKPDEAKVYRDVVTAARGMSDEVELMEGMLKNSTLEKVSATRAFRASAQRAENWRSLIQKQGITKDPEIAAAIEDATNWRAGPEVRANARAFIDKSVHNMLEVAGARRIERDQVPRLAPPRRLPLHSMALPETTTLKDPETGALIEGVPLQDVGDFVRKGAIVPEGTTVPVDMGTGQIERVGGSEATRFFLDDRATSGRAMPTERAWADQEERKSFEGVGDYIAAPALGAVDALTFGGSNLLIDKAGGGDYVRGIQKHQGTGYTLGEIGGMLLPLAFTGGAAAPLEGGMVAARGAEGAVALGRAAEGASLLGRAGEIATALPRGVTALGEGAGSLVTRGVGAVGLSETGLLARTLSNTARAGVEGGFYGVGNAVSESVLKNEDLTAEKIAAAFSHGALLGGALGGGGTVAWAGARRAGGLLGDAGGALLSRVGGGAERVAEKEAGAVERAVGGAAVDPRGGLSQRSLDRLKQGRINFATGEQVKAEEALAAHLAEGAIAKERGALESFASDMRSRKAIQATGANEGQWAKLEAKGPGVRERVVNQIIDDLPGLAGKKSLASVSHAEMAAAAKTNAQKWGKEIGESIDGLDALQSKIRPDLASIQERGEKLLADKMLTPFAEGEANALAAALESLNKAEVKGPMGFRDLHTIRRNLDDKIRYDKLGTDPLTSVRKDLRDILEDELIRSGEAAAKEVGGEFTARYVHAKEQFQAAKWVEEATAKGARAEGRNRSAGLSEQFGMLAGGNMVGAALGSVAGPVGTLAGNAIGGIAGAMMQNYARRYGDQVAATIADRAIKGDALQAIARTVDDAVGKHLGGIFSAAGAGKMMPKRLPSAAAVLSEADRAHGRQKMAREEQYRRAREAVTATLQRPEETRIRSADIARVSPSLAGKVADKQIQLAQYLANYMPKEPPPGLQGHLEKPRPVSAAEQDAFLRRVRALTDPASLLEDAKDGRMSREAVEAVRDNYPLVFAELRDSVQQHIAESKKPLPYAQKVALGTLLDFPADRTMQPEVMRAYAATMATAPVDGAGGGGGTGRGGRAPNIAVKTATKVTGLETG